MCYDSGTVLLIILKIYISLLKKTIFKARTLSLIYRILENSCKNN